MESPLPTLWICLDCGTEAYTRDPALLVSMGWAGLDGDTAICPICRDPEVAARSWVLNSRVRIEQSRQQLVLTEQRIRQMRGDK